MYIPRHFEQNERAALCALIREHPLGAIVSAAATGFEANHMPFLLDESAGLLRGHVARGNPLWKSVSDQPGVLVIFQGPQHYVTPSWYPAKREHGKVVPTWNFAAVHVHGRARAIEDAAWLRIHLTELTREHEGSRDEPWRLDDAPAGFIDQLLGHIVGLEIAIDRFEGKWKISQNRPAADRQGVAEGLRREGGDAAAAIARLMQGGSA